MLAIKRHYSYTALAGITLAATFLASVVRPGFGALTDRYRLGWLSAAGLASVGTGVGLSGLGGSYLITWLPVALSGVGVAAYHPEATRTVCGLGGASAQAISWFTVGGTVAQGPARDSGPDSPVDWITASNVRVMPPGGGEQPRRPCSGDGVSPRSLTVLPCSRSGPSPGHP